MNNLGDSEKAVKAIFGKARKLPLSPSPYLETRTLAVLRERARGANKVGFWRRLAVGGSLSTLVLGTALTLLLVVGPLRDSEITHAMSPGHPFVVKVDVDSLKSHEIVRAQIILPEGINFFAKDFPQIEKLRVLDLAWRKTSESAPLSFVVQGVKDGIKTVKIEFFDKNNMLVATHTLKIKVTSSNKKA